MSLRSIPEDSGWQLPEHSVRTFAPRKSRYCIVTAAWDEGERSYRQYREMVPHTGGLDFIVASRGDGLRRLDERTLSRDFNIRCLIQVDAPGQSSAYRAAIALALRDGYEGVIMIDSNGKDDVDGLPSFVRHLEEGYDLVQGCRYLPGGESRNTPPFRTFCIRVLSPLLLYPATGYWYRDQTNGFKAFSRTFLLDPRVQPFRDCFRFHNLQVYLNYAAAKHRFRLIEIPARRNYPAGKVPTKFTSLRQLWDLLADYVEVARGRLDP